jgi:choline-sulfatase
VVARELYDHVSDPNETQNVATAASYADAAGKLSRRLADGWKSALPPATDGPTGADGAAVGVAPEGPPAARADRFNVLFLAVDDMKDWVNCLGGYEGSVHTPHIDRLARRGMLFTNAHCPSPKCAPSRSAIMTGLRPSTTGLYDNGHWWLPNLPDVTTIPGHFRNHGYHVAGAGKIFHHTAGNHPPNQWDDFFRLTFRSDPWFRGVKLNYPWSKQAPFPQGFPFSGVPGLGHENDWGSLPIADEEYDDALSADYAVRFLERADGRPFFLACGLFRPHLPWYVPRKFFDLYSLDEIVLPAVPEDDLDDIPAAGLSFAEARRSDWELIRDAGKWKQAVRAYLASITYADSQLGRVLDALDRSPHGKNTIIVLWSDHGWHLGEKQHWHKSTLWEESTRVPLIISVPGYQPGTCDRPVSLLDLFPTLSELTALAAIQSHDGTSLTPLLRDPQADWDRCAVIEFQRGNAAVRSQRYRYIRYRNGGEELYDHRVDPHEWDNLAASGKHADVKRQLAGWIAKDWAESAAKKNAFVFDPEEFKWTCKKSGKVTYGGKD